MNIYKQVLVIIFNFFAVSLIYGYGVPKNEILILKDAKVVYLGESIQELYELPDFVEAYLFFNHEDKLKKVIFGYQEM